MNATKRLWRHRGAAGILLLFIAFGIYLFCYSLPSKPYSEEQIIRDLIWLDGWAVILLLVLIIVWLSRLPRNLKLLVSLCSVSVYGFVATNLFFDGTPFGTNAYWGDQKFRLAMILKFAKFGWMTDFYYKDLPPFYPPLYYFGLSLYARIFSVETYKMLKVGSMLTYLFGPVVLYYFWRKIVSPFQAFFITVASFLFCSFGRPFQFYSPPAFLANLFFIPWWLCYIERVRNPQNNWKFYVGGAIIGAIILMTYFYPFFIGITLLVLRATIFRSFSFVKKAQHFSLGKSVGILLATAALSAVYWFPALLSVLANGMDRSRGGWHHIGSPGLNFYFLDFSVAGMVFLATLVYLARRHYAPVNRALLLLIGTSVVFHLIASILGAVGRPLNLAKAMHFVEMAGGTYVGFLVAGALRWSRQARKYKTATAVLVVALFLIILNNFNSVVKRPEVKSARQSGVPAWKIEASDGSSAIGSVCLCGIEELFSFFPTYTFIAANEHYSHPASRFKERYDFLYVLQEVKDPYIFHLALKHNIFDEVDFFVPRSKDGKHEIVVSLSNYPNRLYTKILRFDPSVVSDSSLFNASQAGSSYELLSPPDYRPVEKCGDSGGTARDSLMSLAKMRMLRQKLDSCGKRLLDEYLAADWSCWSDIEIDGAHDFGGQIDLSYGAIVEAGDSIFFALQFCSKADLKERYKVFFHLYDARGDFHNFDFSPIKPTSSWQKWDLVECLHGIPRMPGNLKYVLGFFRGNNRLGTEFHGRYEKRVVN